MLLAFVRYGLPILLLIAGLILLFAAPESTRYDGFAMCWGSAFALIVWNLLFRIGFSGDKDRDKEEAARRYLMEHGHWPDEKPRS